MRFWYAAVALFATAALAEQQNAINIPSGQSTLQITAGEPQTITWSNPSSGTVTIKLQQSNGQITPDSGTVLASAIPASSLSATFTIPPSSVNSFQYTIEILDDTSSAMNFSPNFGIMGATGTSVASASSAASTSGASASASASSMSMSSAAASSAASSISSAAASSSASAAASSGAASSSAAASSSTAAATAAATSAPDSGAGKSLSFGLGGLVTVAAVAVAAL